MHSEVSVTVDRNQEFRFDLEGHEPMPSDVARRWLDDEFMRLECEPLRASGKVLLADKVLTVARAAGPVLLADPDWFQKFARAPQTCQIRLLMNQQALVSSFALQPP